MSHASVFRGIGLAMLLVGVVAATAVAQGPSVEDRLKALEMRIAALEQKQNQANANVQLETEARTALAGINQLVETGQADKAKVQLAEFMTKYGATQTAGRAAAMKAELDVVGKTAPTSWGIQKWFQGEKEIDLASKKPTLVVFWEEWCPHCRREVPKLQAMFDTLKGKGLQVVGLTKCTKGSTEEKVQGFITEQKVGYPIAKEDGSASSYFAVAGIPAAAILKDGKVVWRGHPGSLTEDKLKGLL